MPHGVEDRLAVVDLDALDRMRAVAEDQVGAGVERGVRELALILLALRPVLARAGLLAAELHRGRAVAIVMRYHDDVDERAELLDVGAHAIEIAGIDRDAVE